MKSDSAKPDRPLSPVPSWRVLLAALLVTCLVGGGLYYALDAYMLSQAEKNIQSVLLEHKGIHEYVQRNTHPALYQLKDNGEVPQDFYSPELLSSTFMLRNVHAYYNEERAKLGLPPIYYKMAALNPRNPINRADKLETRLIEMFNKDKKLTHYHEVIEIDGQKYLYFALPFLANNEACLKCHGRRDDAPRQLRDRYPGQGGFNEKLGEIRAIEFVRAPMRSEVHTFQLIFAALLAGVVSLMILILFNRRLRSVVRARTQSLESELSERQRAEAALKEREDFLKTLVESSLDAIVTTDTDRTITSCNTSFLTMYGYRRDEVVGRSARIMHPSAESFAMWGRIMSSHLTDQGFWKGEWEFMRKDGAPLPVEVVISAHRGPEGEVFGYVAIHRDITERRRAEEALRESEERYRLLVESANEGIVVAQDGIPKFFNSRMLELTGMSAREYASRPFIEHVHPDDRAMVMERHQRRLNGDPTPNTEVFRVIDAQGQVKWILPNGVLIQWEGRPATLAFFTDITERQRTEEALRVSEEKLRGIFDTMNSGILLVDSTGRIIFANKKMAEMFGCSLEQLIGTSYTEHTHGSELESARENMLRMIEGAMDSIFGERLYQRVDGGTFWGQLSARRLFHPDGSFWALLGVIQDITAQKLASEQRSALESQLRQAQKMEAIGTLAGGIAHDFNNILAAIMGYAEMAHDDALAGRADPADLKQILASAERARQLVLQILAFSRKDEPDLKVLDLNKAIRSTRAILERTLPKMIDIQVRLAEALPPVQADPTQLEQVMLNLAANAADAMSESGQLTIETQLVRLDHDYCSLHLEVRPGLYVLLQFTDTGEGMDESTREHIFDPFFTTKAIGKGTGLGLSSAYGIIKNHGGHIHCYSEKGMGTTFKIYLPVYADGVAASLDDAVEVDEESWRGDETILLADDEEDLRQLGGRNLESMGYRVLTASSGEEAVEMYGEEEGRPHLVIMDLGMPGMGGHRAMKAILEVDPKAKVLIASGYSAQGRAKGALEDGAVGYVGKPFRRGDLLATVRRVLDTD